MTGRAFPRAMMVWALGLILGSIAGGLAVRHFNLGWPGALVLLVILALATLMLMRTAERRTTALGCGSPALTRYNRRMMLFAIVYMAGFFAATMAYKSFGVAGIGLWIAACAPSVGILGMIWTGARLLIEETDEYLRMRFVQQVLFGIGIVLVVMTVWGFFEQFGLVPHVPSWVVLPIFAFSMGLRACLPGRRS